MSLAPAPRPGFFARYGRLTLFMLPIGVAMNFVGGQIAILLKLPIYLDTIGTILVAALCGGLPGALVGAVSNVLNSITSPQFMAYAVISVIVALAAGLLSRWGMFTSWWRTLIAMVPLGLLAGIFSAIITIMLFGGLSASGNSIIVAFLFAMGLDMNASVYIAGIPFDMLDKGITVFIVFGLLRAVPTRLLVKLPLGGVYLGVTKKKSPTRNIVIEDDELALGR